MARLFSVFESKSTKRQREWQAAAANGPKLMPKTLRDPNAPKPAAARKRDSIVALPSPVAVAAARRAVINAANKPIPGAYPDTVSAVRTRTPVSSRPSRPDSAICMGSTAVFSRPSRPDSAICMGNPTDKRVARWRNEVVPSQNPADDLPAGYPEVWDFYGEQVRARAAAVTRKPVPARQVSMPGAWKD